MKASPSSIKPLKSAIKKCWSANRARRTEPLLLQNQLLPLPTLFAVDTNSPYYHEENKGSIFYAESWALTHYLTIKDDHENTHRLNDYMKLVSEKVDPVTAGTRAFGDLKLLQSELEKYIQIGKYYYSKKATSIQIDDTAFKVQALSLGPGGCRARGLSGLQPTR